MGVDWALSESSILRAEYIYDDFNNSDFDINDGNLNPHFDTDINTSTVRAAIIWNFGGLGDL
ncbi:hypothetical protein G5V57_03170 [Nordella sp. HKS 07]|uniref:outer membrane protein n=1 Tax=Nordella sp. HKS 07 TaxID=2712222 RepID=UPI0013E19167|nr:hypothetical protein [Nordella sp. HKS 07]QIG46833.1 hypothetical protein G5V57_03170 [Nordella sp. HKS 07]